MKRVLLSLTTLLTVFVFTGTSSALRLCNTLPAPANVQASPQGLSFLSRYSYQIVALNSTQISPFSTTATAVMAAGPLSVNDYVRVSWDSVPGASKYFVYRTLNSYYQSGTGKIAAVTTTSFDDTNSLAHGIKKIRCT